ncbi:hypothetical protein B0H13DRAFT_1591256, partial [Mycena leptocephala]
QIRTLSFSIINPPTLLLPLWKKKCAEHNLPVRLIPRDVATRWNSTYDLLVFAVKYEAAIDTITGDKSGRTLRDSELELEEWRIVHDLVKVLKDAILFFSREDISSNANVLPTMGVIDRHLTRVLPDDELHTSVRMAPLLAKKKMNKYYGSTDDSNIYRIAMSALKILTISRFLLLIPFSFTSWPEACLLQAAKMASRVDRHCKINHSRRV